MLSIKCDLFSLISHSIEKTPIRILILFKLVRTHHLKMFTKAIYGHKTTISKKFERNISTIKFNYLST